MYTINQFNYNIYVLLCDFLNVLEKKICHNFQDNDITLLLQSQF
jgi:hypothetical protein